MTEFSPVLPRQFGTPFDLNSGEFKAVKRCRGSVDDLEENMYEEEDLTYGEGDFHAEKRSRLGAPQSVSLEDRMECAHPEKRSRISSYRPVNLSSSSSGFFMNDSSATIFRLEGELRTERNEVQVKEEQLHMAELENNSINEQLKSYEAKNAKLNDENNILKRAVNIQEGRLKELNVQNHQLKDVLAQAAQRIAHLESCLGAKSPVGDVEPFFDNQRPPDVY